jgi:putative protease
MKLVATLKNPQEILTLKSLGASVLMLETDAFTRASEATFSLQECQSLIPEIHEAGMQAYVLFNTMIHESDLEALKKWLVGLVHGDVDAIVAFDLSVAVMANMMGIHQRVIYQPGTFNTHCQMAKELKSLELKGTTISREATIDEVIRFALNNPEIERSLVGHGYLEMFVSRRKLVTNHFRYRKQDQFSTGRFTLQEMTRPTMDYPISEDRFGTQIFRAKKVAVFSLVTVLDPIIDDLFISRVFISDREYYDAIKAYRLHDSTAFMAQYGADYEDLL